MIGGVSMTGLRVGKVQFDYDPEIRPHRLVRSGRSGFHPGDRGSNPLGVASHQVRAGHGVRPEPAMRVT